MHQNPRLLVPSVVMRLGTAVPATLLAFSLFASSPAEAGPAQDEDAIEAAGTIRATTTIGDPANCRVTPCDDLNGMILVPNQPMVVPASRVTVEVRNDINDPVPNAVVTCEFTSANTLCSSAVITGTTDGNGRVDLLLFGGGCAPDTEVAGMIKANNVPIRVYRNVKSPDFDGAGGDGFVYLPDLLAFSSEFGGGSAGCHDYDNNSVTNLGDLIIMSQAFTLASHCP